MIFDLICLIPGYFKGQVPVGAGAAKRVKLPKEGETAQENKEVWDQELIRILALKNNNNFNNLLIAHINVLNSEDRNTRAVINNITAEIIASFDEKQSKKFQNKLGKFLRTIDNISEIKA